MLINLDKGGTVDLATHAPTLKVAGIGLGWDAKSAKAGFLGSLFGATDAEYDLDAVVFVLNREEKLVSDAHFVFFNNKASPDNAVAHGGDNRTGEGDGDDETVMVDFARLPREAEHIDVWVTIYKAAERKQSFAEVESSFVRLYDRTTGQEQLRFELQALSKSETALHFCRLTRGAAGWTFHAVGQGHHLEIGGVLTRYK